jgi:hypothetical protein
MSENLAAAQKRVTNDTANVEGVLDGASAALKLSADQADDAGDSWRLVVADGGALELGNNKVDKTLYNPTLTVGATALATAVTGIAYAKTGTLFSKTAHGFVDGDTVVISADATDAPLAGGNFVVGQLYYVKLNAGGTPANEFTLAATLNGTNVVGGENATAISMQKVSNNTVLGNSGETAVLGNKLGFFGATPEARVAAIANLVDDGADGSYDAAGEILSGTGVANNGTDTDAVVKVTDFNTQVKKILVKVDAIIDALAAYGLIVKA